MEWSCASKNFYDIPYCGAVNDELKTLSRVSDSVQGKELGLATVAQSLLGLLIRACIVIEPWSCRRCTEL